MLAQPKSPAEQLALTEPRWYACYTRARHERQVEELLARRGFESYVPRVVRVSQWKDRKRSIAWPLFPSYVFSRFALGKMHDVLTAPGVATIVRLNGRPVPIQADELENVKRFAEALGHTDQGEIELQPMEPGQWVRVKDGPFVGVKGIVVQARNRRRVIVGIQAIGHGIEIDVQRCTVEPI